MSWRKQHAMAVMAAVAAAVFVLATQPGRARPPIVSTSSTPAVQPPKVPAAPPISRDPAVLALPGDASAIGGYNILIADRGNNRLLIVSPQKRILWEYHFKNIRAGSGPDDAFFADDGKSVIASDEHQQLIQVIDIASKAVTWEYGKPGRRGSAPGLLDYPDDAYKLPNGNIMVADIRNCRIMEISSDKQIVRQAGLTNRCWAGPSALASPNGDKPLPNGHVLVSTIGDHSITELDETWKPIFKLKLPIRYPSDPQMTKAGNFLVAGYTRPGRLIEIARDGKIVWDYTARGDGVLNHPSLAMELPNGNVLLNDDLNHRVIVIDKATNAIVWQYGVTHRPGTKPGYLSIPDGLDIMKAD